MDVADIRRANLGAIVERDGLASVAKRVGKPDRQINDMLAGRKSFGEKVARDIEKKYAPDLSPGWLDKVDGTLPQKPKDIYEFIPVEDSVYFNILDVKAACGNGAINHDYPEIIRTIVMPLNEAQRLIGSANKSGNIQIIVATKDSMIPSIYPDDLLFVDISIKDYVGEAVYILLHGGELVCKRISLVGREITVSSDNAAYPSWSWREKPDETKIIGKVIRVLPIKFKKFGSV